MLVNDNLSVAQCLPTRVGLHIGQDDIPIAEARRILGPDRLLGISIHSVQEAQRALEEGIADYAGVGPVHGTQSKAGVTEDKVLTPRGASAVIAALSSDDDSAGRRHRLPSVLIGGLNAQTAARSLVGAASENNYADGIAVISAIVARRDPDVAARELRSIVDDVNARVSVNQRQRPSALDTPELITAAAGQLSTHRNSAAPPLIQTLTSHVSSTFSANIALAFSSSPIMSHQPEEAADLGHVVGGVVLNIGTISQESRLGMRAVGAQANRNGRPVVLDPVGVGASAFRRRCVSSILDETQVTLIKGNAAELSAIAGLTEVASRGVDSGAGTLRDPVGLVQTLARREKCLVLLTGQRDYLSDGQRVVAVDNGHPLAARITGTGCALGVMLAAAMANVVVDSSSSSSSLLVNAPSEQLFTAALMALLAMTIASEKAAVRSDVHGPGTFIPALIDEVANLTEADIKDMARVKVLA